MDQLQILQNFVLTTSGDIASLGSSKSEQRTF